MRRGRTDRERPPVLPVEKAELSGKHPMLRIIAASVLALFAVAMFTKGLVSCLSQSTGWREIEVNSAEELNCSQEFVFSYCLGVSGIDPTLEYKRLSALYTDAVYDATHIFSSDEIYDDVCNLKYLSDHPNEEVDIDPALYDALLLLEKSGVRTHFFAGAFDYYSTMMNCAYDFEAEKYDPTKSADASAFFRELAGFTCDEGSVSIKLENGKATLSVSEEYLDFAAACGMDRFIDLGYMKNAFIADYLADRISAEGYTAGSISSFDGYVRSLFEGGTDYKFNLFERVDGEIYRAAVLDCGGASTVVSLRSFPVSELDRLRCRVFEDGEIRSMYLSDADGICRNAVSSLTCVSNEHSASELLMKIIRIYIADELDVSLLQGLESEGISSVWCEKTRFCTTGEISLSELYADDHTEFILCGAPPRTPQALL